MRRQGLVEEVGLEEPIALVFEGVREAESFVQLRPQQGVGPEPRLDHEEPGRAPRVPVDQRLAAAVPVFVVARPGAREGASEEWKWRERGREKVARVFGPAEKGEMVSTERSGFEHFLAGV